MIKKWKTDLLLVAIGNYIEKKTFASFPRDRILLLNIIQREKNIKYLHYKTKAKEKKLVFCLWALVAQHSGVEQRCEAFSGFVSIWKQPDALNTSIRRHKAKHMYSLQPNTLSLYKVRL